MRNTKNPERMAATTASASLSVAFVFGGEYEATVIIKQLKEGGCIEKGKDLAEINFGNQRITIRSGADCHRYESPDRNIARFDRCLVIYTEMRRYRAAANCRNCMNIFLSV